MMQKLNKLFKEKGQGIVEYAMVLGFVALLAVGLWSNSNIKKSSTDIFKSIGQNISNSIPKIHNYSVIGQDNS